jgi:hypothetical protein
MTEELEKGAHPATVDKMVKERVKRKMDPTSEKEVINMTKLLAGKWAMGAAPGRDELHAGLARKFMDRAETVVRQRIRELYPNRTVQPMKPKEQYPINAKPAEAPKPAADRPAYENHRYHSRWATLEEQLASALEHGERNYPEHIDRAANAFIAAEEHHGTYDSPYKRAVLSHLKAMSGLPKQPASVPVKEKDIPNPVKEATNFTDKPLTKPNPEAKNKAAPPKVSEKGTGRKVVPVERAKAAVNRSTNKQKKVSPSKKGDDPTSLNINHGWSIDRL